MTTETRTASDIKLGDRIATVDGTFRTVTGVDHTPAAVRIRTGRSTHWMRSKADAIFTVAA